jgi:DNA-binding transcriptional MerR regulator
MGGSYTIGRLAREAAVPASTIRYYERRGLVQPDGRTEGNYRLYSEAALERLRFVRAAQEAGFTLSDIGFLLRLRSGDAWPCAEVQALIASRLEILARQIDHLERVERMLRKWLRACREVERTGRCGVLEGLRGVGRKGATKSRESS